MKKGPVPSRTSIETGRDDVITEASRALIETWRLGFVATADADGQVNLSPKGTFIVVDQHTLAFAEMRSPKTVRNIHVRPEVEINFVDILSRKGIRLRGNARVENRNSEAFERLFPDFAALWPDLTGMFNAVVLIEVSACRPLMSPVYEKGASEAELRALWKQKIQDLPA